MVSLVMNPGLPEEQQFTLPQGTVTIGRTKDNAVYCLHKSLSRKHAQVDFDGVKVKITDLQSKNGIFVNGKRVSRCELLEGDSFRCGDITFLVEGTTTRSTKVSNQSALRPQDRAAQTLPSPFAIDPNVSRRPAVHVEPNVTLADEQRYKDKLFLLIRASELCVSELSIDRILDDLIALAVQVLDVDRIVLLALDDVTLDMRPRVIKTFVAPHQYPYSTRVVDWVVDHGSPASFADVSRDRTLPGELARDASVRGAMCVPINPGGGTIGVIYADSLSRPDCFRPDDLALLRALANLAAVTIESDALRSGERRTAKSR
ncbi:MAG: FHA domain-containing protein [Labilithrix sp.]|nr:FHA domain-containing protein [Labilithrix sp.]MCW5835752.1 FHA domain-containing protein [Labilithrix sp.]